MILPSLGSKRQTKTETNTTKIHSEFIRENQRSMKTLTLKRFLQVKILRNFTKLCN